MKYLSLVLLISILSCNPVKQVLKDKRKLDQVAEQVIRQGYCVNDTVFVTEIRDTVIYKDSVVRVIDSVPCKDFDTTIGRAKISVRSGVLKYSSRDSIVYRTRKIINTVRDRSLERILGADVQRLDSLVKSRDIDIREIKSEKTDLIMRLWWWKFKFWSMVGVAIVIIFRKQLIRIVGGFV